MVSLSNVASFETGTPDMALNNWRAESQHLIYGMFLQTRARAARYYIYIYCIYTLGPKGMCVLHFSFIYICIYIYIYFYVSTVCVFLLVLFRF